MTGKDKFLKLGNNQDKILYQDLKGKLEKKDIEFNNSFFQIFNIFDTNKNDVLETSEIQNIWNVIDNKASKNGNSIFEEYEAQQFLDETLCEDGTSLSFKGVALPDLFAFVKNLTVNNFKKKQSFAETEAINFLKDITLDANEVFEERQKEAGGCSAFVNMLHEIAQDEYAKSHLEEKLSEMEIDISILEKAASGQYTYFDNYGLKHFKDFNTTFKERFGVDFNEKAIKECSIKAQEFANIKTAVEMINKTKDILDLTTVGDVQSRMNPQNTATAIIQAFQLSDVKSIDEINQVLAVLSEKYKDHPVMKKYGEGFKLMKDANGNYLVYTKSQNGRFSPAQIEQLELIVKELKCSLNKALADSLGVEYDENVNQEQLENLINETYEKHQKEYEEVFAKAYGENDVKSLADAYVLKQQIGVANVEMVGNIISMGLMVVPGGAVATSGWALKGALLAKHSATGAKVVKGLQLVDKAKTFVKGAQTLQKISQVASPFIMANMTLRPTELLEQLTSINGMSAEEWNAWGEGVLQSSIYMAVGMGASKLAETGAAMYKTKALVNTLKSAGKSTDEIMAMIKANPVKFPNEIVKSLSKVDTLAKTLQVSSEVALDIGSTVLVNKAMGNGDLLPQDVINSIAFAISGGVFQKQFAQLSTEAKVSFIENALKEYGITKVEAERILKTMDDISAGKIKPKSLKQRLATASSREDFVAIREEIEAMPAGAEKTALQLEYQRNFLKFEIEKAENSEDLNEIYNQINEIENHDLKKDLLDLIYQKTFKESLNYQGDACKKAEMHVSEIHGPRENIFKRIKRDDNGRLVIKGQDGENISLIAGGHIKESYNELKEEFKKEFKINVSNTIIKEIKEKLKLSGENIEVYRNNGEIEIRIKNIKSELGLSGENIEVYRNNGEIVEIRIKNPKQNLSDEKLYNKIKTLDDKDLKEILVKHLGYDRADEIKNINIYTLNDKDIVFEFEYSNCGHFKIELIEESKDGVIYYKQNLYKKNVNGKFESVIIDKATPKTIASEAEFGAIFKYMETNNLDVLNVGGKDRLFKYKDKFYILGINNGNLATVFPVSEDYLTNTYQKHVLSKIPDLTEKINASQ